MGTKRRLDGLGRRMVRIIGSDDLVTAISADAIGGTIEKQKRSFHRAAAAADAECLVIEGPMLESLRYLETFSQSSEGQSNESKEPVENLSFYRSVCQTVNRLQRLAVVIYESEQMDRQALSMLARISRYAKRNDLLFRVVLVGDIPELNKTTVSSGLRINAYVPRKLAGQAQESSAKHRYSVSQFTQAATS